MGFAKRSTHPIYCGSGDLPDGRDAVASIGVRRKISVERALRVKTDLLNRFNKSTRRANHPKVCKVLL